MAKAETTKLYRTFVKGLITEASPLTYPDDSSSDEDNCVITRKGNRTRRFGVDFETNYILDSPTIPMTTFDTYAIKEFAWESVNNDPSVNILVLQIGTILYFYNLNAASISANFLPFTYDFTPMVLPSAATPFDSELSFTSGKGYLFAVGPKSEPFYITYDPVANSITSTQIAIQIRDFVGLNDGLATDQEPTTLTPQHHYNLRNQGWFNPSNSGSGAQVINIGVFGAQTVLNIDGDSFTINDSPSVSSSDDGPITTYFNYFGRYPGNNKQWWVAQAPTTHDGITAGQFDPALLANFFFGSGHAPKGSYVLNAFNKDYSSVSGVAGLTAVTTTQRPTTNTFFSGRVWYGVNDTVYFSQVLDDVRKAGLCYQDGDPTSQFTPDLLATDGGYIAIPEMINVIKLEPLGQGVVVFASNGVWFITGSGGGFSATDIAQSKVSPVGITSPDSVVAVEHLGGQGSSITNNTIFYWSKIGIQSLSPSLGSFGPIIGSFQRELISLTTIQTFFNEDISDVSKTYAKGIYDPAQQIIQWFFKTPTNTNAYLYDRVLNLDLTLSAFYPWTVSSTSATPWVIGGFTTPYLTVTTVNNNVTANDTSIVTDGLGHNVMTQQAATLVQTTSLKYIFAVPIGGNYQITFGLFNNQNYADWQTLDGVGHAYKSYVVTGFEILEDAMRNKQTPYVFCYFTQSENLWTASPGNPGMFTLGPLSSCQFSAQWGWTNTATSNRWTPAIEAYRLINVPQFDGTSSIFDNGYAVVVTKNKIRGRGKAIQFRLENDTIGSGFDILGWAVEYTGGTTP